jgi:hypothetical protein
MMAGIVVIPGNISRFAPMYISACDKDPGDFEWLGNATDNTKYKLSTNKNTGYNRLILRHMKFQ